MLTACMNRGGFGQGREVVGEVVGEGGGGGGGGGGGLLGVTNVAA